MTEHLREGIESGRWKQMMPGRSHLAKELGVSPTTVVRALDSLEREGLLVSQGAGKQRRIVFRDEDLKAPKLRIALMLFETSFGASPFMVELRHELENAGHATFFSRRTLLDMGQKPEAVMRFIGQTEADAWIICSGSREVLAAISALEKPTFALFGRHVGVPMPGARPDKAPPLKAMTRRLIDLGHKRISYLCRRQMRSPDKGKPLLAFLSTLEDAGVKTGEYHCPEWEESPDGFIHILDSLFKSTPPSALILDESHLFHACYHYLAQHGKRVPEDVSLFCMDGAPGFAWCRPKIAHVEWDYLPIARRIARWANNTAKGKVDHKQILTKSRLIDGGTIGPAKR